MIGALLAGLSPQDEDRNNIALELVRSGMLKNLALGSFGETDPHKIIDAEVRSLREQARSEEYPGLSGPTAVERQAALDVLLRKANEPPPAEGSTS
jgi:hypothetical protein